MGANGREWRGEANEGNEGTVARGVLFAEGFPGSVSPATTEVAGGVASWLEGGRGFVTLSEGDIGPVHLSAHAISFQSRRNDAVTSHQSFS